VSKDRRGANDREGQDDAQAGISSRRSSGCANRPADQRPVKSDATTMPPSSGRKSSGQSVGVDRDDDFQIERDEEEDRENREVTGERDETPIR